MSMHFVNFIYYFLLTFFVLICANSAIANTFIKIFRSVKYFMIVIFCLYLIYCNCCHFHSDNGEEVFIYVTVTENLQKVANFYVSFLLHRVCFQFVFLQYLLTSSCTLHRRKFLTNISVHICINLKVLCYRLLQNIFSISFKI